MNIKKVTDAKKDYIELLLLADEQENMIDKYLERGEMFVLDDNGIKAECVITKEANGIYELKNIAVLPECQRKGYGKYLINYLFTHYSDCHIMYVGTGDCPSVLSFYHNCGFKESHRVKNFFIDNYDHAMFEDGVQLIDMVYLKREKYNIIRIQEHKELINQSAEWFHQKWSVPKEAYIESMEDCLENSSAVPQWYVVMDGKRIIAGIGVIKNDFHDRKDLTPNICSVYVEKEYRNQGIAGKMLQFVCDEFLAKGIETLYLVTDHSSFYERYGWKFLLMVQCDGEAKMSRMYIHKN